MSVAQWNTHRCFRPPMSGPQRQKIGEHLGRLGLPYLTLCPYDPIATSLPSRLLWEGDGQTRRRGIPPDIQTTTHSLPLTGSIQGAAVGWVGVLLLEGDRVSVYCVEGHRFNLIMPEGPSATTSSYSSTQKSGSKQSSTRDKIDWVSRFTKGWL